jgi:hypothetical protein
VPELTAENVIVAVPVFVDKSELVTLILVVFCSLFALQGQLATRDLQLAEEQQKKAQVRTVQVIEKEVIYRDRIKNPDTAKCVADSGLLNLYDASLGLDKPAE